MTKWAQFGYTSHGHPIPGATLDPANRPHVIAGCDGVGVCDRCSRQAHRWTLEQERLDESDVEKIAASRLARAERAEATLDQIRGIISDSPLCDKYGGTDVISCGWKRDMMAIRELLRKQAMDDHPSNRPNLGPST